MQNLINQWAGDRIEQEFTSLRCTIASPQAIRSWSYGQVRNPETINYRTFKPEREGLFCSRIFGPIRDFECSCGKYKRVKHRGVVCEKCGVEVTRAHVRRERMGHVELASPVAHIWFLKSLPSRLATVLDMMQRDVEKVLYFEAHVVTDVDPMSDCPLKVGQILTEESFRELRLQHAGFTAKMGGEAIQQLLRSIDLDETIQAVTQEFSETSSVVRQRKIARRLKLLRSMRDSKLRPEWMILTVLPVLPPDLRPLVPIDGGRFTSSDLNDLYRRVINRNNRLERLLELHAPDIIVRNEKRMLQEAIDALLDNGRRGSAVTGTNRRPLKSLSDMVRGKSGRFRQNLLGKRVDYSGRSVIVVGPTLRLHQCGLPKDMALELFRPFVYGELERREISSTIRTSRKLVDNRTPEVWDVLGHVIKQHPVLLNRAPTLHRLGIQAFEPVLVEGKAIQLHPLVCTAFNADFDGDQMAVHIPLTLEAQIEARVLIMSTNNILSPANGQPVIVPTKDVILGLYYLTRERVGALGEGKIFANPQEAMVAHNHDVVHLHARIKVRVNGEILETTAGRLILHEIVPKKLSFSLVNQVMNSSRVSKLVREAFSHCGQKETVIFSDQLMYLGFDYATRSGLSMAIGDLPAPPRKQTIIDEAAERAREYDKQARDGLVTPGERYNKVVDTWSRATDEIEQDMYESLRTEVATNTKGEEETQDSFNPLFMYADSGARGSVTQMRQLVGMRGLMSRPDGSIIETPIRASFRDGLSVLEYFTSTHGARKGLADTALKTANSGYLTRRLVDVSHSLVVNEQDCGTTAGLEMSAVIEGGKVIQELATRVDGRILSEDIKDEEGQLVLTAGTMIDSENVQKLVEHRVTKVKVRSVILCETRYGICASCYGRDLARGHLVRIGEAIGVIAAQSIGEPGTQLTMRTFHFGGAASRSSEEDRVVVDHDGTVRYEIQCIERPDGTFISSALSGVISITDNTGRERERYRVPRGAVIRVPNNSQVKGGDLIAEWDPHRHPIVGEYAGQILLVEMEDDVSVRTQEDVATGRVRRQVLDVADRPATGKTLRPTVQVIDDKKEVQAIYHMPSQAIIELQSGDKVLPGDIVAYTQQVQSKTRDITGGLPRVIELFEARKPKEPAILAECTGRISFGKETKRKFRLVITPPDSEEMLEVHEELIAKERRLSVTEGDMVTKGDVISDGPPNPHDLLRLKGVSELANTISQEILEIYRLQGVDINEKHIEVILRQMLHNVTIVDAGDTGLLWGDQINEAIVLQENEVARRDGKKEAKYERVLLGLTKSALCTESFISAASFQETTKVLTEAAVSGSRDHLRALKENVIVGRLIPAGTGFRHRRLTHVQSDRVLDGDKAERELRSALEEGEGARSDDQSAEGEAQNVS